MAIFERKSASAVFRHGGWRREAQLRLRSNTCRFVAVVSSEQLIFQFSKWLRTGLITIKAFPTELRRRFLGESSRACFPIWIICTKIKENEITRRRKGKLTFFVADVLSFVWSIFSGYATRWHIRGYSKAAMPNFLTARNFKQRCK